jgi:hypothetical protein
VRGEIGPTVANSHVEEHLCAFFGHLPPWSYRSDGGFTAKFGELVEGVVEDVFLLLNGHGDGVLGGDFPVRSGVCMLHS